MFGRQVADSKVKTTEVERSVGGKVHENSEKTGDQRRELKIQSSPVQAGVRSGPSRRTRLCDRGESASYKAPLSCEETRQLRLTLRPDGSG